jgi:AcrR family transcriptional regulator
MLSPEQAIRSEILRPIEALNEPSRRLREIREAGVELFFERGYVGTSMKDIAARLDIRAPSLYNHVESKQEILRQISFEGMETLALEFDAATSMTPHVLDKIRRGAEAHARVCARRRKASHVANSEIAHLEMPAQGEIRALRRDYTRTWIDLVERGVSEGHCDTTNAALTAFAIIDMCGSVARWFKPEGPFAESAVVSHYGDMALRLVGVSGFALEGRWNVSLHADGAGATPVS